MTLWLEIYRNLGTVGWKYRSRVWATYRFWWVFR